uniref:Uncharacterized protein n=1 Tax=Avena sativa TaxID=4498 RepID=A0ACD5X3U8_AVESA
MAHSAVTSGVDRISALPLDVRLRLLSLLPVDEAVRTGELSREWRGLWTNMPRLRLVGLERIETAEGFDVFVNHLIILRGHFPLDEFKIEARISETDESYYPYANLWIQYALKCKVRVLHVFCEPDVAYNMKLTLPLVAERLTTLNLSDVDLEKCSALVDSKLCLDFSSCPLLKDLRMQNCGIAVHKISSKSLQWLCITSFSCFNEFSRTWISAPSLISLELSDFVGEAPVLESMPFLQRAFVRLDGDQGSCDVLNPEVQKCDYESCECCYGYPLCGYQSVLLNGLSDATHLELIAHPEVYIYRRDLACCPIFGSLKTLLLNEWCLANGLHGLVCILQHSPILEELTLLLYDTKGLPSAIGEDRNHDPIEQTFACAHLKVVNIKCQVMTERVFKALILLSTCGIPHEHIRFKVTQSCDYSFSFEMPQDTTPSTGDDDAAPSATHGDATTSSTDDD